VLVLWLLRELQMLRVLRLLVLVHWWLPVWGRHLPMATKFLQHPYMSLQWLPIGGMDPTMQPRSSGCHWGMSQHQHHRSWTQLRLVSHHCRQHSTTDLYMFWQPSWHHLRKHFFARQGLRYCPWTLKGAHLHNL
jgi:hypothetical protein